MQADRSCAAVRARRASPAADGMVRAGRDELREARRFRHATRGTGNGASYAAITSSLTGCTSERRSSCPATISLPTRRMNAWKRSHSSFGARAPMPVFSTTSRATRSGFSTAKRKPIGPPQSCTTSVTSRRSSSSANRAIDCGVSFVRVPLRLGAACRSARSRSSRERCSAPAARARRSPSGRGTTTSARRGAATRGCPRPRRRSAFAARRARRSAARSRIPAAGESARQACGRRRSDPPRGRLGIVSPADDLEPLSRSLPYMKGGAMPTYSIHHFSATLKPVQRPKGARRIAMSARKASVASRRTVRRAA